MPSLKTLLIFIFGICITQALADPVAAAPTITKTKTVTVTKTASNTAATTETVTVTATPPSKSCVPPPPVNCSSLGYLIQQSTLFSVDLLTGASKTLATGIGGGAEINAMGYNIFDDYLYGQQQSTGNILKFAANGSSSVVATPGLSTASFLGDIDTDGQYWFSNGGAGWWHMDLVPGSPTYGQVLQNGTSDISGLATVSDWVYVPNNGSYLFSISVTTSGIPSLVRWSMTNFTWSTIYTYPNFPVAYQYLGGIFSAPGGLLYASDNYNGKIYTFPLNGSAPAFVTNGPISSKNDGARCALAQI